MVCQICKAQPKDTLSYIFLGHTYEWGAADRCVDHRVEKVDFSRFDRVWLGGDVCSETTLSFGTLSYINDLFEIGKPENHWALGNHDTRNGNLEWIEEFTGRPTFYAYSKNGITTVILDGNISPLDCEKLNAQFALIDTVCDTISSGHLIFLMHHGIFSNVPGIKNPSLYAHSELKNWMSNCQSDSTSYVESIYPKLVDVKQRGVNVINIMGDMGANEKSFEGVSDDGIVYLASGINNTYNESKGIPITAPDLVLVLKHVLSSNELTWEFVKLVDLPTIE